MLVKRTLEGRAEVLRAGNKKQGDSVQPFAGLSVGTLGQTILTANGQRCRPSIVTDINRPKGIFTDYRYAGDI